MPRVWPISPVDGGLQAGGERLIACTPLPVRNGEVLAVMGRVVWAP